MREAIEIANPLGANIPNIPEIARAPQAPQAPWAAAERSVHQAFHYRVIVRCRVAKLATLIQAARLYERRNNTAGPLSSEKVDDVAYGYGAMTELDTDVAASIAPYRKLWAAA